MSARSHGSTPGSRAAATSARLGAALAVAFALLGGGKAHAECVETGPTGAARARLEESFPERAASGYAVSLHVVVSHGKGETVLPRGLDLQTDSDTARALREAGFMLPERGGEVGPRLSSADDPKSGQRRTTLDLPLVALPSGPGRHTLVLPPLPVSIARANNDVYTLCTKPHTVIVEDPTSSTPDARPRPNPGLRPQREEWVGLERALAWAVTGALLGGAIAWVVHRWRRRPKASPPPPPPRPPWEVAFERLHEARHAGLLETKRFADFFDRVNDAVREYLGARFGFDGLESTTDETLAALRRVPHFVLPMPEVASFLQECDLVKFADVVPTLDECERAIVAAERLVRVTMPPPPGQAAASAPATEARA